MKIRSVRIPFLFLIILFLISTCRSVNKKSNRTVRHGAKVTNINGSFIYIDKIPNRQILQIDSPDSSRNYHSFKIGFEDSAILDEKQRQNWGRYFNYEMQGNWVLLVGGDSVRPVFFQALLKKTAPIDEGILVFETLSTSDLDTIVYKNRFDNRKEIFILKTE